MTTLGGTDRAEAMAGGAGRGLAQVSAVMVERKRENGKGNRSRGSAGPSQFFAIAASQPAGRRSIWPDRVFEFTTGAGVKAPRPFS